MSGKQWTLVFRTLCGGLRRLNILEGSVRSGKTWVSLVAWALWLMQSPKDGNYLMCAKTLDSLKRNCLAVLEKVAGKKYFSYSLSKKEAYLMGRKIYLEGAADVGQRIKYAGCRYLGYIAMRSHCFRKGSLPCCCRGCLAPGAKLIGTTNPDSPEHWLKRRYLDRAEELDLYTEKFLIDDNEFLSAEFVDNLKKEYTGVFYDRFICGEWVNAEGLVYPNFCEERHVVSGAETEGGEYYISVDYGTANPCSMGLWQVDWKRSGRCACVNFTMMAGGSAGR